MGRYADIRARFGNWVTADPGASVVVPLPGGPVQANEIIGLVAIASDNVTLSATGYTHELGQNAGTLCRGSFLWKRATGGETSVTVTHTAGNSIAIQPFVLRGVVKTGNPVEASSSAGAQNTGAVTAPAITTLTPKAFVMAIALEAGDSDTSGSVTFGAHNLGDPIVQKMFDRKIETLTDELSLSIARGWKLLPGATGAYAITISGLVAAGDNVGMLLAFTPEDLNLQQPRSKRDRIRRVWFDRLHTQNAFSDYHFAVSVSSSVPVDAADSGAGTEAHSVVAVVGSSENGAGSESPSTLAVVGLSDAGTGSETYTVQMFFTTSDSGAGTESVSTSVSVTQSESGTGTEAHSVTALVGPSENGSGSESLSTLAVVGLTDTGAGSESPNVSVAVPSSETGAGTESTSVTVSVPVSNTGTGTEATSVLAAVPGSDVGTGSESTVTTGSVTASDSGVGTESTRVVTLLVNVNDAGTGTEAASQVIGQIGSGYIEPGYEGPRIRYQIPLKPVQVRAEDGGYGSESFSTGRVHVIVWERGRGLDFVVPFKYDPSDLGRGTEFAHVLKTEDMDSELRTLLHMSREGILTAEEYAVLIEDHLLRRAEA